jgi:hypothetical protein
MVSRLIIGVVSLTLVVASCSAADSRPDQFDGMTPDQVGCVVTYGDNVQRVVGPLGPSDSWENRPNDYTLFRIARTALDVIVVVEQTGGGSNSSTPLNDLPADGIVARGPFRDGGNPGYVVTCWRGDT